MSETCKTPTPDMGRGSKGEGLVLLMTRDFRPTNIVGNKIADVSRTALDYRQL